MSGFIGIGMMPKEADLSRLPGWDNGTMGYHGDDGNFFYSTGRWEEYGPTYSTGDVVGCGINYMRREVFFTKKGVARTIPEASEDPLADLYPTVGMQTKDECVTVNFGQHDFKFDLNSYRNY